MSVFDDCQTDTTGKLPYEICGHWQNETVLILFYIGILGVGQVALIVYRIFISSFKFLMITECRTPSFEGEGESSNAYFQIAGP